MQVEAPPEKVLFNILADKVAAFFNGIIDTIVQQRKQSQTKSKGKAMPKKSSEAEFQKLIHIAKEEEEVQNIKLDGDKLERSVLSKDKELQQLYRLKEDKLVNTPKKPVSSFFIFYQEHSKQLSAKNADNGGTRVAQIVADKWKSMTQQQKRPYYEKAQQTKDRYLSEMRQYIRQNADQIEEIKQLKRIRRGRRRKLGLEDDGQDSDLSQGVKVKGVSQKQIRLQDRRQYSHRPKAPVSSFFIYYQQQAKNIALDHNETVGSKLARIASSKWKGMSPAERQKYEVKAQQERQRYHIQMEQYKKDYPEEIQNRRQKISGKMKRKYRLEKGVSKGQLPLPQEKQIKKEDDNQGELNDSNTSSIDSEEDGDSNSSMSSDGQNQQMKPIGSLTSFYQYFHTHIKEFTEDESLKSIRQRVNRAVAKWNNLAFAERPQYDKLAEIEKEKYGSAVDFFKQAYPEEYELLAPKVKQQNKEKDDEDEAEDEDEDISSSSD